MLFQMNNKSPIDYLMYETNQLHTLFITDSCIVDYFAFVIDVLELFGIGKYIKIVKVSKRIVLKITNKNVHHTFYKIIRTEIILYNNVLVLRSMSRKIDKQTNKK